MKNFLREMNQQHHYYPLFKAMNCNRLLRVRITLHKLKYIALQIVPSTHLRNMQTYNENILKTSESMQTTQFHGQWSVGKKLYNLLCESEYFERFAEILDENEQTNKFVKTIHSIASGNMPVTNLAWKAALDMGNLFSCKSTMQMEYDEEWLEFCQIIYHMFGGGVINALQGRGHFSHVTSNKMQKGKYNPVDGKYNFPVPLIPTLKKLDIGFPSEIPIEFVKQSLDIMEDQAQKGSPFVLSFDGKLIAPGCKGDNTGDCNMLGVEGPPTLGKSMKILRRCDRRVIATAMDVNMKEISVVQHYSKLQELVSVSSFQIKQLWGRITGSFYLCKKLISKCGDNEELKYKHCH